MKRRGANSNAGVPTTTYGMLRTVVGGQFVLEADDHRVITYRTVAQMQVQKDGKDVDIASLAPGDHLIVDSSQDDRGYFTATEVRFDKAGTPEDRAAASETWDLPKLDGRAAARSSAASPQREPGDERPVLRRRNNDDDSASQQTAQAQPPAPPSTPPAAQTADDTVDNRPATTMKPTNDPKDPDDSGPPVLKRGRPPASQQTASASGVSAPANAPAGAAPVNSAGVNAGPPADESRRSPLAALVDTHDDEVISKTREVAWQFAGALPDFMCQQLTTRYETQNAKQGWTALDIVTADVAYQDGKESYKNIKVGNRPVNKAMEDIEGTRSTGEFSSIQLDLLSPDTAAIFRRSGTDTIHGRGTWVYSFEVPRERSHWRIEAPSQLYYPEFRGSIWIDKQTFRVLRIEQEARRLPVLFPFDTAETATDYDYVRLSTPQEYVLPVDAEVLSCVRGSSDCARNKIEFRNYRKFGADSSITFDSKVPQ